MTEDKYKRITQAQFEIWMDNPATVVYLQCLNWSREQITEAMGKGGFIDSSNAALTMSQVHSAMGKKAGLAVAGIPLLLMEKHEMIENKEVEE